MGLNRRRNNDSGPILPNHVLYQPNGPGLLSDTQTRVPALRLRGVRGATRLTEQPMHRVADTAEFRHPTAKLSH